MAKTYGIAMERTDGTMDAPHSTFTNKAAAIRVARLLAQRPHFDCARIYVDDIADDRSVWSAVLPQETSA